MSIEPSTPQAQSLLNFEFEPGFVSTGLREPPGSPFAAPRCSSPQFRPGAGGAIGISYPNNLTFASGSGSDPDPDGSGTLTMEEQLYMEYENELQAIWMSEPNKQLKELRAKLIDADPTNIGYLKPVDLRDLLYTKNPQRLEVIHEMLTRLHSSKTFWQIPNRDKTIYEQELLKKCLEVCKMYGITRDIKVLEGSGTQYDQFSFWSLLADCVSMTENPEPIQPNYEVLKRIGYDLSEELGRDIRQRWEKNNVSVRKDITKLSEIMADELKLTCQMGKEEIEKIEDQIGTSSTAGFASATQPLINLQNASKMENLDKFVQNFDSLTKAAKIKPIENAGNVPAPENSEQNYEGVGEKFSEFAGSMKNICSILKEAGQGQPVGTGKANHDSNSEESD